MYIAHFFSIILISCGAAALYLGLSAMRKQFREYVGNVILFHMCFASAVWCYGFGILYLTVEPEIAYWGRTVGMLGVFAYLILAQVLVGVLGRIPRKLYIFFCGYVFLGIFLYPVVVNPNVINFYVNEWGMTYTFKAGLANNIYSAYSVIYGINMLVSVIFILKNAENRRSKVASQKILITLFIIMAGMVLDTILPMFNYGALPGSSMTQFIGLLVTYYAIVDVNKTRITPLNMSQYAYASVSEPIMVFTPDGYLKLSNEAAQTVFARSYKASKMWRIHLTEIFEVKLDHLQCRK